jgi:hypothetical protein
VNVDKDILCTMRVLHLKLALRWLGFGPVGLSAIRKKDLHSWVDNDLSNKDARSIVYWITNSREEVTT